MKPATMVLLALAGCASAPVWQDDVATALSAARRAQRDLVVFFALPGRDVSDRMQRSLGEPVVGDALAAGDFAAAICDGSVRARLYSQWVGYGEGMGIVVLDSDGRVYASRPGPQDPPELAAFLRRCATLRASLAALRDRPESARSPAEQHALGVLFLELGCVRDAEPLLVSAAMAGVADAHHRLARLHALNGNLVRARQWLVNAPQTPASRVTEGYVLWKERRHGEAVQVLEAAARDPRIGDERQRALLYLGKALHDGKQDERAVAVLQALAAEGTGSTFEAAALHTLAHVRDPQHGHDHGI